MARMVHSTDNFSVQEARMHFKLAGKVQTTYGYLNLGESLNCRICANLRFLLATLTYVYCLSPETFLSWLGAYQLQVNEASVAIVFIHTQLS